MIRPRRKQNRKMTYRERIDQRHTMKISNAIQWLPSGGTRVPALPVTQGAWPAVAAVTPELQLMPRGGSWRAQAEPRGGREQHHLPARLPPLPEQVPAPPSRTRPARGGWRLGGAAPRPPGLEGEPGRPLLTQPAPHSSDSRLPREMGCFRADSDLGRKRHVLCRPARRPCNSHTLVPGCTPL